MDFWPDRLGGGGSSDGNPASRRVPLPARKLAAALDSAGRVAGSSKAAAVFQSRMFGFAGWAIAGRIATASPLV